MPGLRSGCCPDPEPAADGAEGRHLIHSYHYKNVNDDDSNHISAGEVRRVPWVAITPVVHAIHVLERMVPEGELLLGAAHHGFRSHNSYAGALKKSLRAGPAARCAAELRPKSLPRPRVRPRATPEGHFPRWAAMT